MDGFIYSLQGFHSIFQMKFKNFSKDIFQDIFQICKNQNDIPFNLFPASISYCISVQYNLGKQYSLILISIEYKDISRLSSFIVHSN